MTVNALMDDAAASSRRMDGNDLIACMLCSLSPFFLVAYMMIGVCGHDNMRNNDYLNKWKWKNQHSSLGIST